MKRMMTLLLSALLMLSLTACGRKNDNTTQENMAGNDSTVSDQNGQNGQSSQNGSAGGSTDNSAAADNNANMGSNYDTPHIDGAETPAESSGKSVMRKSGDMVRRAGEDMKETVDGESWEGMLRNGRVKDTDGKLKDGENALHGRYGAAN